ncbi:hypothetical protein Pmar_PMAR019245 [Perkinsus marinus ATCC 50983]|uniref:Uncharacterized protein n=1 Tax=Perkinsus marinus (strain ATCC 50983 / TXsc) TaxID=423536 RepID=C5KU96_PERM5|nr:hypothetical protein Pmar_PMAR019245 [Perkinsus marinus ATCC 50983]EER12138.1 hypothetical protein Pmar_PMAR019245 [Perkinsus marinus ATCC 50983]|eukprot:XP_002780343.1 hypothetical protein Pmar_PMAR019245 [Perkinsus marinus ATCC 50983]
MEKLGKLDTAGDMWREAMLGANFPLNHPAYAERVIWQLIANEDFRRARSLIAELPYDGKRERWHGLCSIASGDMEGAADAFINAIMLSLQERNTRVRAESLTHLSRLPEHLIQRAEREIVETRVLEDSSKTEKGQAKLVGDVPDVVSAKNQTAVDHSEDLLRFMLTQPGLLACENIGRAARATALLSGCHYRQHSTAVALAALERAVNKKSVAAMQSSLIRLRNALRRGRSNKSMNPDDQKNIGDGIRSVLEAGAVDEPCVSRIMQALGCEEQTRMTDNDGDRDCLPRGRESACDRPGHLDMTNTCIAEAGATIWGFPEPIRMAGLDGRISSSSAYSCGPAFECACSVVYIDPIVLLQDTGLDPEMMPSHSLIKFQNQAAPNGKDFPAWKSNK